MQIRRSGLLHACILVVGLFFVGTAGAQDGVDRSHGDRMVREYFDTEVRKIQDGWLETVNSLADWQSQLPQRRQELREMLGLEPLPERTELHATVTGRLEHEEFFVEKLHFQSMPGLYVTANLYVPKNRDGRLPGILYVCGHGNRVENGVSLGSKTAYQRHAAWYARHGYVALIIDTIQLAEIEGVHHGTHNLDRWWWWNRGYTPAGVETWNGIRALDYLASRPEVDPERLAVTGRSGGGGYSWFIAALDERIKTSVPTAGITDLRDQVVDGVVRSHCDCMFPINTERWDFPMLAALPAPRPMLLANGDTDPLFPLDGVMRVCDRARQVYALHDERQHFAQLIVDAGHQDTRPLQRGTYEWMHAHLKGADLESEIQAESLFEPRELTVFDTLPEDEINTRIDELFVPPAAVPEVPQSRSQWQELRASWMEGLRAKTFAGWPSADGEIRVGAGPVWNADGLRIEALDFESQESVNLRAWILSGGDAGEPQELVVTVADESTWQEWLAVLSAATADQRIASAMIGPGAEATTWPEADPQRLAQVKQRLSETGTALAVVAPRGVGPTSWTETEQGHGIRRSFMLLGQTVDGMQVWDVHRAVAALTSTNRLSNVPVTLEAEGTMSGIALYAALFQSRISSLDLHGLPETHRDGPILLNVRKTLDMPQALAAALESVESVRLHQANPENWSWPLALEEQGRVPGTLRITDGTSWWTASRSDTVPR